MRYWIFGFRINNVINSNNRGRTFTSELFGFGISYYTGVTGGFFAATLVLGPLGWIIAIIAIGVAVVTADYRGKHLGDYHYGKGASLYSSLYSQPLLTLSY